MRSLALLLLLSCGQAVDPSVESSDARPGDFRARAGETTVWLGGILKRQSSEDGRTELVAAGSTSRTLTDGNVFVFDDPYGAFAQPSARRFEVRVSTGELTGLIVGVQTFIRFHFVPSAHRPEALTGRMVVRPQLTDFSGSGIFLRAQPSVVSVGGRPVLRIDGGSSRDLTALDVSADGVDIPDVHLDDPRSFAIDLPMDHAIALAGAEARLVLTGTTDSTTLTKRARLELRVSDLALTEDDPYEVWPNLACVPEVASCLDALPAGASDLSSCGSYLEVQRCGGAGVLVDDVALQGALQRSAARIDFELRPDAPSLVGEDRLESFLENARLFLESRLEPFIGRRYAGPRQRDEALDAEIDAGLDEIYARPLDHTEVLSPLPNDPARARQVSADALLLYLSTFDAVPTEWARPVIELTKTYRRDHVSSVGDLRFNAEILLSDADTDIYGSRWLGAHVEVTVNRASGEVTHVLLEID